MRLKVRSSLVGQLTIRLADTLVVRSIVSDRFGRMFNLRVTNQNTVLVNLPTVLPEDSELTLTIVYGGRLAPQEPDRETLAVAQDEPRGPPGAADVPAGSRPAQGGAEFPVQQSQLLVSAVDGERLRDRHAPHHGADRLRVHRVRAIPPESPKVLIGKNAIDARHTFVFKAARPARYLSFIVSRFVPADRLDVTFADKTVAQDEGSRPASTADPLPGVRLLIEANPRQTGPAKKLAARAGDIMRFYQSVIGDAPYPSFTIALVESMLPGGHSPAYFAQLNQPLPNSPVTWRNDPAAFENYPEFFMAHEIAHQWWGHGVGWQNYHDQWLSEGFSQYFAALYASNYRGDDVFQGLLRRMRRWAINESDQGPVHLGYRVGHIKGDGRAFRAIVYNKAAMVLHMMRLHGGRRGVFWRCAALLPEFAVPQGRIGGLPARHGRGIRQGPPAFLRALDLRCQPSEYRVHVIASKSGSTGPVAMLRFEQTGELFDLPALVTLTYGDGRTTDVTVRDHRQGRGGGVSRSKAPCEPRASARRTSHWPNTTDH